jgi:hypothetical protein
VSAIVYRNNVYAAELREQLAALLKARLANANARLGACKSSWSGDTEVQRGTR